MKIAVIGSGIAGMGVAYLLHKDHDIVVYEKEDYIGGHSRTKKVATESGEVAVDTGFIVFNYRNYPNLCALYSRLDVPVTKSNMSFGVSINNGWLEYGTQNLASLLAQKSNLLKKEYYGLIRDIFIFNKKAKNFIMHKPSATIGECIQALGVCDWFVKYYLLAMAGAIWSTPQKQILNFSAQTLIDFFDNHGLLSINNQPQWYTVQGGSHEYTQRLTQPFREHIRLQCAVKQVRRLAKGVEVVDSHGNTTLFDQVVFACHSDQALQLLTSPHQLEQRILGDIRYQTNTAFLHSDLSFMPKRKKAWASWVYLENDTQTSVSLSYWMNSLQPLPTTTPVIVTLNPSRPPLPELTYDQHQFEHPLLDKTAIEAQKNIVQIQGVDRIWYCGAWQGYGFHEDGLRSAVDVAKALGAVIPWQE